MPLHVARFTRLTGIYCIRGVYVIIESLSAIRQARAAEAVMSLQRRSVEQGTDGITMEEIGSGCGFARRLFEAWR
jgi:hypothetical protein